jgi:hypothetical protein
MLPTPESGIGQAIIGLPTYSEQSSQASLSAKIQSGAKTYKLSYCVTGCPVAVTSEPFLAASLFPAMCLPLQIVGEASPRLLEHLPQIQEILCTWDPSLGHIDVQANAASPGEPGPGIGCFFSGGVDSFYSILKHAQEITALIFVHGFDVRLSDTLLRSTVSTALRAAAAELKKPLIEIETDLREFSDSFLNWELFHGAAFARVVLLLSGQFKKVYLPATYTYANLFPWGSHPLLDPLWSTERTAIIHDGCEASRVYKIACVAKNQTALRYLRVCWENREGKYNCGRCEKCLRTMISLQAAGVLDKCPTFDRALDLAEVATMPMTLGSRRFAEENLQALTESGRNPELQQALRKCIGM